MKRIFDSVRDKLDEFAQAVEHLSERVQRTEGSISASRARLTGTFKTRAEQEDLRASLLQMTDDLPTLQKKLGRAKVAFVRCKQFIAELPDDAIPEPVKVTTNGVDLSEVTRKITAAQDELKALAAVPIPGADIEQRVREYVRSMGHPKIAGVGAGEQLDVKWPSLSEISVLAVLLPDKMREVILAEVERAANDPLPPAERKKRMVDLRRQIDELQRQGLALGADASDLPPEVILGVRVVRREQVKRVERRERAA
jgi:hypothetical protein